MHVARVLVVDDSPVHRQAILDILARHPGEYTVVGIATTGEEAIKQVILRTPDLITLDLEMPKMDGFTFLRWLMSAKPTRTIVVSSKESHRSVFRAMELGAMDFVVKPLKNDAMQMEVLERELLRKINAALMGDLSKVRLRMAQAELATAPPPRAAGTPVPWTRTPRGVLIASSTGGPPALQAILQELPADFPLPILISQHMPTGFTALFAKRLAGLVKLPVKEAQDGDVAARGVMLAPGGGHLILERAGGRAVVRIIPATSTDRYVPSADRMIAAATEVWGGNALGVILTGMGEDGVLGLATLKREGGFVVAEDESTCIVYGMPRATVERGLADRVAPLHEIAGVILGTVQRSRGGGAQ